MGDGQRGPLVGVDRVGAPLAKEASAHALREGDGGDEPKLLCRGLWKLYGPGAKRTLEAHGGDPPLETLRAAGLVPAVRGVDLAIRAGEIFVIMGLSGSGKSTLVRCLSRLIEPTRGELRFEGEDLGAMSARAMIRLRRHKFGMVFQHFALLPHLSVLDNVAFPLAVRGERRTERERRAHEMIELVGLAGREHHLPRELSGGQQQRVGIARSLAVEPELWFLDEPFSALDPLIRREMQDEFLRLQARLEKCIVFITHDFDEAIRLADRIAIMKDGALIQVATPEELVLAPADDYVAEFTRYVPRAKVASVRSIARAARPDERRAAGSVEADAKVESVARQVLAADAPLLVVERDGRPIGLVDRESVTELLAAGLPA